MVVPASLRTPTVRMRADRRPVENKVFVRAVPKAPASRIIDAANEQRALLLRGSKAPGGSPGDGHDPRATGTTSRGGSKGDCVTRGSASASAPDDRAMLRAYDFVLPRRRVNQPSATMRVRHRSLTRGHTRARRPFLLEGTRFRVSATPCSQGGPATRSSRGAQLRPDHRVDRRRLFTSPADRGAPRPRARHHHGTNDPISGMGRPGW